MSEPDDLSPAEIIAREIEKVLFPVQLQDFQMQGELHGKVLNAVRAGLVATAAQAEKWPYSVNIAVSDAIEWLDDNGGSSNDIPVAFLLAAAE
jgi:hypothetical protein